MDTNDPIVIVGAARTPLGDLLGSLSSLSCVDLGAAAIKAAVERAKVDSNAIDEAIMGCVLSAGVGQAPARQAVIKAGLANNTVCSTINKVCGSGMKSVMLAHDLLQTNSINLAVAGGMESMSNAPYLLKNMRTGHKAGHTFIKDEMLLDGLEDAFSGESMGLLAENTATKYKFSRSAQDEFAITSLQRAQEAIKNGWFNNDYEITSIDIPQRKGEPVKIDSDEHPTKVKLERVATLKPSFKPDGTITPANSSAISDGAAALVLTRLSIAKQQNLVPLAKILATSSYSADPAWYTTAPVKAMQNLFSKLNWDPSTPDLYEINEAFAVVTMAAIHDLKLPHDKVNIHGGSCALGHPIGASGTRIICTLLGALKRMNKSLGVASLCIGGGEATAIAIERM